MMRHLLGLALIMACYAAVPVMPAIAGCSDAPAPEVYWRRCVFDRQDLTDVDLTEANLRDASFKRADLSASVLAGVDAQRAKFVTSIMEDVILDGANLARADLTKANLQGASLRGANLTWARMFRADLTDADLTDARLDNTDLLQAVLDGATWTDGKTVCAEGSIGRCRRAKAKATTTPATESGPETKEAEPPA